MWPFTTKICQRLFQKPEVKVANEALAFEEEALRRIKRINELREALDTALHKRYAKALRIGQKEPDSSHEAALSPEAEIERILKVANASAVYGR